MYSNEVICTGLTLIWVGFLEVRFEVCVQGGKITPNTHPHTRTHTHTHTHTHTSKNSLELC